MGEREVTDNSTHNTILITNPAGGEETYIIDPMMTTVGDDLANLEDPIAGLTTLRLRQTLGIWKTIGHDTC